MRVRSFSLIAGAMIFGLSAGCASLAHGPLEQIEAVSEPAGADVSITCQGQRAASGVTPARLIIRRKLEGCTADFSKEGFVAGRLSMERGFSRFYWGNVALAGEFPLAAIMAFSDGGSQSAAEGFLAAAVMGVGGLIYDRVTGAMFDHPERLSIRLQPAAMERHE